MKKLIIMAIAAATGILANAENIKIVEKDKTGKVVTNTYDAVEYATICANNNTNKVWKLVNHQLIVQLKDDTTISKCDEILSKAKFVKLYNCNGFSKCHKNIDNMILDICPAAKTLVEDTSRTGIFVKKLTATFYMTHYIPNSFAQRLALYAPNAIKMQLRKEGKSFVEKDGKNPVQERVNALTAALNAKRLAGLNQAMTLCGFDYGIDYEAMLLPEEDVKKLCDDIFYGRADFSEYKRARLRTHLGVEEYNAFVKKYNND